ncbi:Lanosterol 14-alpha-demethylase [Orbilia oligospora]|nr:Lanosterol 14-alpha-demethylase [Orbilia oligospora]KAF3247864.1 Lanosterol 14-alpha-demethylase [Orbilia oligospora]KAF3254640.1 Lanosterol 14-alpha-demethylase [Orbilia oligospora]
MGLLSGLLDQASVYLEGQNLWVVGPAAFGAFIVLSVVINVLNQLLFKDPNQPPVVFHWFPFLGSTVVYGMEPYKFFNKCQEQYGDVFTFILLGRKMTVTLGPKGNEFVFNGKHADLCAEEAYTHLTTPVFGSGVVYDCPNHMLMEQKKFMKFGLTTETFKAYVPLIKDEVVNYFQTSPFFNGQSGKVPLSTAIPQLTLFTASRSLQGREVREALTTTHAALFHDLDMGFTPVNFMFPWLPLPHNAKRDKAQRAMAKLYLDIIARRKSGEDSKKEIDMIWNLMNRSYKSGETLSDLHIAHCMIALLMAGQHTSMATTTWTLLHLAAKPEIQKALYDEQIKVFGKDLAPLTYEKLSELQMVNNVVKEILRIHPPLHSIMRKVKSPLHVPDTNFVIPSSHFVMAAPGVSAMDEKYFKNAKEFDPFRWVGHEADEDNAEKFDFGFGLVSKGTASPYLPFGAGRHRCIGEQFANVQLGTIISTLVREFEFSLPPGQKDVPLVDYNSMVALAMAPAMVHWKRRPGSNH